MKASLKEDQRRQRMSQALKSNLKKRKKFQDKNKIKKNKEKK